MKILDRYRITEVTADMLWVGDRFAEREVDWVEPLDRKHVKVHFTDGSDTIYTRNTVFRVKRR